MMPRTIPDPTELARSLLAELPPADRAELLTEQLVKIGDLRVLTTARNRLTSEIEELILARYGAPE